MSHKTIIIYFQWICERFETIAMCHFGRTSRGAINFAIRTIPVAWSHFMRTFFSHIRAKRQSRNTTLTHCGCHSYKGKESAAECKTLVYIKLSLLHSLHVWYWYALTSKHLLRRFVVLRALVMIRARTIVLRFASHFRLTIIISSRA